MICERCGTEFVRRVCPGCGWRARRLTVPPGTPEATRRYWEEVYGKEVVEDAEEDPAEGVDVPSL